MKTHKTLAGVVIVLLVAIAAQASPLFGTWKGELNGKQITLVFTRADRHTTGTLIASGGTDIALAGVKILDAPPTKLVFQVSENDAGIKLASPPVHSNS